MTEVTSQHCVVYVTCGTEREANTIANTIVEEKLAACVNILNNVQSVFIWEGAVQHETEWLLMIKTTRTALEALRQRVKQLHLYSVPEFIALPIVYGSEEYLRWVSESISS